MSKWKEYNLSEVGKLQRGKSKHRPRYAFHLYGRPFPFIQTGQIKAASKYIISFEQTYSNEGLAQSKLWPKGKLCITIAANIAEIAILSFDACFPDSVIGFIPDKNKCDLDFAFYTLKYFQKELQQMGDGSVRDNINLGTFEQIKFPFPPLAEQIQIASFFSCLDNKIDLLHRQNKTLEQLAETLFRQLFVEEAEEKGKLSEYIKVQGGYAFKSKDFKENGFAGIIKITNISMGFVDIIKSDFVDESIVKNIDEKFKIKTGDFLIAMTGAEIGKIGIVEKTEKGIWVNQRVGKLESKIPYGNIIGHLALKSREGQDHIINTCSGSAQENISTTGIEEMIFASYNAEKADSFGQQIQPYFDKIIFNLNQIRTLTKLRNTLLPKLMSGEVRVKNN